MIIDVHTHTFPEKIAAAAVDKLKGLSHTEAFTDGTEKGLLSSMERAGIDLSVILPVATSERQVQKINDASAALNEYYGTGGTAGSDGSGGAGNSDSSSETRFSEYSSSEASEGKTAGKGGRDGSAGVSSSETAEERSAGKGGRLFSLGCMHPDCPSYREELSRIKSLGLKGIKIHPAYQNVDLDDIRYLRILDRAAELGLIVLTHSGLDVGFPGLVRCSPRMARHVTEEIGPFPFILAHMGGWRNWDEVLLLLSDTGVYIDTSYSTGTLHSIQDNYWKPEDLSLLDEEGFMRLYAAFGPDRILFGSDSPWGAQDEVLTFLRNLPISEPELKQILGGNAASLFGFTGQQP